MIEGGGLYFAICKIPLLSIFKKLILASLNGTITNVTVKSNYAIQGTFIILNYK